MAGKKSGKTTSQRLAKQKSSQLKPAASTALLGDVRALLDDPLKREFYAEMLPTWISLSITHGNCRKSHPLFDTISKDSTIHNGDDVHGTSLHSDKLHGGEAEQ